jgi:hypothetical protein
MAQLTVFKDEAIAGPGTAKVVNDAPRLAALEGGMASEWAKVKSWNYKAADGLTYEIHAYRHVPTGKVVEWKTKIQ